MRTYPPRLVAGAAASAMALAATLAAYGGLEVGAATGPTRVNSGGTVYETRADHWDADAWFEGGRSLTKRVKVPGTRDDDLFATQRVALTAYHLPAAAAGTYRTRLLFAEIEDKQPGERVFDVLAEGAVVLPGVDVAAAVGQNRAYAATFDVAVTDGVLDLGFRPHAGEAAVAAVEVEQLSTLSTSTTSVSTTTTAQPVTTTSTTAPSTTTTAPPPPSPTRALSWRPPALTNPTTIYVTNSTPYWLPTLDATRDYVIVLPGRPGNPQSTPLNHGVGIVGGRNVVVIGGEIVLPGKSVQPDPEYRVGMKLRQQRGTIHVEGVKILNASDVINLDQRYQAIVQLQNIYGESSPEDADAFHNDNLQTWAGPAELRVDGWSGRATFQGFFFNPDDKNFQNPAHPSPRLFDLRRVNIVEAAGTSYVYMRIGSWPINGTDLWGQHGSGKVVYTGYGSFPSVQVGVPAGGDFVPASSVGAGYVSPGYAA